MVQIEDVYTSIGCNRKPACLDWGNNGLVIYGASCSVCLLDPNYNESAKIIKTFVKHTKPVNCVKWIRISNENEIGFVSGGADGLVILWNISNESSPCQTILKGHTGAVNFIDVIKKGTEILVATASDDSSVRLWSVDNENIDCFQILSLNKGICLGIALSILPKYNRAILAEANDDNSISLWVEGGSTGKNYFQKLHVLKGHEDWIRGLDFAINSDDDLLLCSSSQDTFIRLWKLSPRINNRNDNSVEDDLKIEDLFSIIDVQNTEIVIALSLESVLQGNEGWACGVQWKKKCDGTKQLLSSSMDKTLIIWEFNDDIGIWTKKFRLGEVGAKSLGFLGGKFSGDGKSIIGHSFEGGLQIWKQSKNDSTIWEPSITVTGHCDEVRDICWEPRGKFLFSVSADRTTRIHAPFRKNIGDLNETWHEIARPQVHGYGMQTIAAISRYKFASGGEEKVIRVFEATADFIENFRTICNIPDDSEGDHILKTLPKGASVPSSGLSNKAVNILEGGNEEKHVKDEYPENYYVSTSLKAPPQEETLMQNTLWPEIHKLYGHGFEIFALTSTLNSKILASTCKATSSEHAHIFLWDTVTGKQIQKLASHQLTVTQLKFSPNNEYLLSVSRDRSWSLFRNNSNDGINFELEAKSDKVNGIHTRIIWSCDWSHNSKIFATASRDSKVILWTKGENENENSLKKWKALESLEISGQSITAVCFAPCYYKQNDNEFLIAVGFESGQIRIYKFLSSLDLLCIVPQEIAHHLTVRKLQFSPCNEKLLLASGGDDNFVKIIEIKY